MSEESLLMQKIYSPYFISNRTILEFNGADKGDILSIKDIIWLFIRGRKKETKLYFKVNNFSEMNKDKSSALHTHGFNNNSQ